MKKIVMIDDDPDITQIVGKRLKKISQDITLLSDGWKALAYLVNNKKQPDVIILDLMLPAYTGQELLRTLRSSFPATKIFIFSAYATSAKIPSEIKVEGVFCKTAGIDNLLNAVQDSFETQKQDG